MRTCAMNGKSIEASFTGGRGSHTWAITQCYRRISRKLYQRQGGPSPRHAPKGCRQPKQQSNPCTTTSQGPFYRILHFEAKGPAICLDFPGSGWHGSQNWAGTSPWFSVKCAELTRSLSRSQYKKGIHSFCTQIHAFPLVSFSLIHHTRCK